MNNNNHNHIQQLHNKYSYNKEMTQLYFYQYFINFIIIIQITISEPKKVIKFNQ